MSWWSRFVAVAAVLCALSTTGIQLRAAGTISGVVFEDFNGNGLRDTTTLLANSSGIGSTPAAFDRGVAGVQVRAFDGSGIQQGPTATTDAGGNYSIAAGGTGPYRVEFTSLPAGYRSSAAMPGATGDGTMVQFVPDGNSSGVNLAVLDPSLYCVNNPTLVTSCFVFGNAIGGAFGTNPAVVDFPYSAGSNSGSDAASYSSPATHALVVAANQVGSVFGLGYRQATNTVYAAAFMKKHSGFGPAGTGAIYAIDATSGAASLFADLNVIFGAGTAGGDPHAGNGGDFDRDNGDVSWDAVGKVALGGLEVSPDGSTVYVVNLSDRRVYALPTSGALTPATVASQSIPLNAPGATGPGGADLRPFGLQWHRGQLFVGIVNTAESTQGVTDLRAYVYAVDPASLTFGAAPMLQFDLDYPRGNIQTFDGVGPGEWQPWRATFATQSPNYAGTYPQPMLSGLAFDRDSNLVIGLRDRAGDQFGFFTFANPANTTRYEGVAGGDSLLAAANTPGDPAGGWTLEANAQAPGFGPTAGAGNLQGPGNGEYFFPDSHPGGFHDELTTGAVLQLPGFPDVVVSAFDPGLDVRTGGFMWLRIADGSKTKGYEIYDTGFNPPPQATYSKANGFGEMVAICLAAPIEIGNRVWDDLDGDGIQDPGESGLDGVTVELLAPGGAALATAVTADGGQYYFSSRTGISTGHQIYGIGGLTANTGGYQIRIAPQSALGGRSLTQANTDASPNGDSRDSDGQNSGGNAVVVFATGPSGANDHTFDFGFTTAPLPILALGDLVWYDTNDNGIVDAGEVPIPGVDLVLYRDNGDVTFDTTTDTLVATRATDALGRYLFTGLPAGNYFVQVPGTEFAGGQPLTGYRNSTTQSTGDAANNRDHGAPAPVAGQGIVSELVNLAVGAEPVTDDDTDPNTNTTIDFGFHRLVLGNLVWIDLDNNGVVNGGESGLDGVPVELLDASGTAVLQTTTTAGGGIYQFAGLAPGEYRVRITPPAGYVSSSGPGYEPAPDPDDNADNDDNGTTSGGTTITSLPVQLTPGGEPTVLAPTGTTANTTLDFGLNPANTLSLGNLVWLDANDNGRLEAGEAPIPGVALRLIAADGVTVLATTTTDASGHYLFAALDPGVYRVEVAVPLGVRSSTDTTTSPDPDNDIDDDDNGVILGAGIVRSGPVTLTLGGEPVNDGDTNPNSNLTVDFGFLPTSTANGADVCLLQTLPPVASPGGLMTMTFTAVNRGPAAAADVVIDGMIPAGTTLESAVPTAGGSCTVNGGVLDCRWPGPTGVGPGASRSVTVTLRVTAGQPAGSTIWAWFMAGSSSPESYPANNMVDGYVFVSDGQAPVADVAVSGAIIAPAGTAPALAVPVNQLVTGRFTVANRGTVPASGRYVLLLDSAGSVAVSSATPTQGSLAIDTPTQATWSTGPIAAGTTAQLDIALRPLTGTALKIQAVRVAGAPADPDASNDFTEIVIDGLVAAPGGGRAVAVGNLDAAVGDEIVTGAGADETPQVRVFGGGGVGLASFYAFDRDFRGGVRVATCDVDANGVDELVVATGPGGGRVRVLSMAGGVVIERVSFAAYEPLFSGGLNVACADLDGDGRAEIVVGPDGGRAPEVRVFALGAATATQVGAFAAYEAGFGGGVRVAAGAYGGGGLVAPFNIATMPGPGRIAEARLWRASGGSVVPVLQTPIYGAASGGGVALDDADGDGGLDVLLWPDSGVPRLLQVFSLDRAAWILDAPPGAGGFSSVRAGVGVLGGGAGRPEIVVGAGPGSAPGIVTVTLAPNGGVAVRLGFLAIEEP